MLNKNDRSDFSKFQLLEEEVMRNPFQQFNQWIDHAEQNFVPEYYATTVSTVSKYGQPSSRVVYIRKILDNGFVFFTNYDSKKGEDIRQNPKGCMNLFWPKVERQIRIEGIIEKVNPEISNDYFKARPRGSKIGAWASQQSKELQSRKELENNVEKLDKEFGESNIQRPDNWGGYILVPHYFEFWQGRKSRLHDRIAFSLDENEWKIKRLNP